MKHVYMVQFDWSTTDADGIETELFDTYEKAFTRFRQMIENEKTPDLSWVGDCAFDENGNFNAKEYELDEHIDTSDEYDAWWNVTDKSDYNCHSFISLTKVEVH